MVGELIDPEGIISILVDLKTEGSKPGSIDLSGLANFFTPGNCQGAGGCSVFRRVVILIVDCDLDIDE